ncbi:MAG TPA: DUF5333 domain-containing protein [Albidovulum sp.]|uniref:DUF5333 domain-containing protein n=1 Tax=Albidovulum sp. TaxID=1872424 RepID=UPI002C4CD457|nr:DUF5333 domain-containing protein [Albidovulum sp.]
MNRVARIALPFALVAMMVGTGAGALEPLGQNKYVVDRLVAARIADRIRKTCPAEIGARMVYAFGQAYALQSWATNQGYPKVEIKRFLKDKAEKRKVYDVAEKYLAANGAAGDDVAGFCALGKKEIAAGSIAGSLIYEK